MKAPKSLFSTKTAPLLLGTATAVLFTLASPAKAAVFAKFDGIDGESEDANHDKWINVLHIDWGAHKPGGAATGQSRRRGGTVVEDVTLTIEYEKASPKLLEKMNLGEVIPKLEIEVIKDDGSRGQEPYLTYKLKDVIVTSYSFAADAQGNAGVSLSLHFDKIEWVYVARDGSQTKVVADKRKRSIKIAAEEEPGSASEAPRE